METVQTTGFVNSRITVTFKKEGKPMKVNLLYPIDETYRARVENGNSAECPFNRGSITLPTLQSSEAHARVSNGTAIYCWDQCDISDCPSYRAN